MGNQPRRGLKDTAYDNDEIPEHLQHLAGPFGPWVKEDSFEFRHINKEAQEWLIRLSPDELADIKGAVSDFVRRRATKKWIIRIFWGATTGFGAVYAAGEKLIHFVQWIGGTGLDPTQIFRVFKGLFGL